MYGETEPLQVLAGWTGKVGYDETVIGSSLDNSTLSSKKKKMRIGWKLKEMILQSCFEGAPTEHLHRLNPE